MRCDALSPASGGFAHQAKIGQGHNRVTPEEEKAARKREKRKRKKEKRRAEQGVWSAAPRAQTKTGSRTSVNNGGAPRTKKKRKSTGVRSVAPVATPPPKVVTVALSVDRLINRLPDRSMVELQQ